MKKRAFFQVKKLISTNKYTLIFSNVKLYNTWM